MRTLADFRGKRVLVAKNGQPGEGKNRNGKSAKNLVIDVPIGTIIRDSESGAILGDLTKPKQRLIIAKGGKGGRGNAKFATPTNRAPRKFEKGEPGEERRLILELRLLADVGLVGLPNAGKSTLISAVSTVKPKVADYPFTTLLPSVGVVRLGDFASFTMADIPGLIEFAHQGKGLGHQFLRHIRRTSVICHLVEFPMYKNSNDERIESMIEAYRTVRNELEAYDSKLAKKPELVLFTKSDILGEDDLSDIKERCIERFISETGCPEPVIVISAVRGDGIGNVLRSLKEMLKLDMSGEWAEEKIPEYIDGEPPEALKAGELSMEHLDGLEEED